MTRIIHFALIGLLGLVAVEGLALGQGALPSGAAGRPDPRNMSGMPRPEAGDPGGQLTIRPIQGQLKTSEFGGLSTEIPTGAILHLVTLDSDANISLQSKVIDESNQGRAIFENLDRSGTSAYYALSVFKRGERFDRLASRPVVMPPEVGVRLMLAGLEKLSDKPAVDDFEAQEGHGFALASPGEIRVRLFVGEGAAAAAAEMKSVELIDVKTGDTVATSAVLVPQASADDISAESIRVPSNAMGSLTAGQVGFLVVRASKNQSIPDVSIAIRRQGSSEVVATLKSDADGLALADSLKPGENYVAEANYKGTLVSTDAFQLDPKQPVAWALAFDWPDEDAKEARFNDVPSDASRVYIARAKAAGRTFLTRPFQMGASFGANVSLYVYPKLMMRLHGGGEFDDGRLWYNVQFSLINPSVYPFKVSDKGVSVPLPKGFVHASVQEEFSARVKVETGEGFRWRGALPPGQEQFVGQFALLSKKGKTTFDMPLPYGVMDGGIMVQSFPEMEVSDLSLGQLGPSLQSEGQGSPYVRITSLTAKPGASLRFNVSGLPQHPQWKDNVRWALGALVVLLLGWALWGVAHQSRSEEATLQRRLELERGRLLDALAKVESDFEMGILKEKIYQDKRRTMMAELQTIYTKLDMRLGADSRS